MKHHITTIAFDYGGVLAYQINDFIVCHMADAVGAEAERFKSALWKFRHDYDLGELEAATYWRMVSEEAGAKWPEMKQEELLEMLMHLDTLGWVSINPGMLRWIAELRSEGYRRLIISNMAAETYDMLVKNSFLVTYFERVILSGWLNINKPDRRIFLEAAKQMDVDPSEILFLDDLPHNVEGARNAGFHALQFTNTSALYSALEQQFPEIPRKGLLCTP